MIDAPVSPNAAAAAVTSPPAMYRSRPYVFRDARELHLRASRLPPRSALSLRSIGAALVLLGAGTGVAAATGRGDRVAVMSSARAIRMAHQVPSARQGKISSRHGAPGTTHNIPPVMQPSASAHLTLLKIGDSLAEELGFGLRDVLGSNHNVSIIQDAVGDTGLARPDFYNWPAHLAQELAADHPRGVIVMLGGDDGQGFSYRGQTVRFGSAMWHSIYAQRVGSMMSEATAAGAHVIWVGLPIMRSAFFSSEMAQMNAIFSAQAASHPGVTFVPTWNLFANAAGSYSAMLPGPTGRLELMRNPDGVHFSGAGDDRLATAVVHAMDIVWKVHL